MEFVIKCKLCQSRKIGLKDNKNEQDIYKYILENYSNIFYQESEMFAKVFSNCLKIN